MRLTGRTYIGRRVASLRESYGDSLRQASMRTGVSHTTIARIESGESARSLHSTLRKIAEGYGVTIEYLTTGRDPRQDFEHSISRLPLHERGRLFFTSALNRTRMVLQFLLSEYPQEFPVDRLARSLSTEPAMIHALLDEENAPALPERAIRAMGENLAKLTGISRHWFHSGYVAADQVDGVPPESFGSYIHLMKKAASAGVRPDVLEMAIDLLVLKQQESAASEGQPTPAVP